MLRYIPCDELTNSDANEGQFTTDSETDISIEQHAPYSADA